MKVKDRARPKLPPVDPGVYISVCVYSIDIGMQKCEYKDKGTVYNNQVKLGFELIGETVEIDGKQEPRVLGRTINVTKSKNGLLRKFAQNLLGKTFTDAEFNDFDTNDLVGKPAQLSVVLNETGEYANIDTIMQLPKGMAAPVPVSPLIRYDMEPWDDAAFAALPDWAQELIKKSAQYQKLHAPETTVDFPDNSPSQPSADSPLREGAKEVNPI